MTDEQANESSDCGYGCGTLGGPWRPRRLHPPWHACPPGHDPELWGAAVREVCAWLGEEEPRPQPQIGLPRSTPENTTSYCGPQVGPEMPPQKPPPRHTRASYYGVQPKTKPCPPPDPYYPPRRRVVYRGTDTRLTTKNPKPPPRKPYFP